MLPRSFVLQHGYFVLLTRILPATSDQNSDNTTVSFSGGATLAVRATQRTVTFHTTAREMPVSCVRWFEMTMMAYTFSEKVLCSSED